MLDFTFREWGTHFAGYEDDTVSVMPEKSWFKFYINNLANNFNLLCDDFRNIAPEEDGNFD